MKNGVKNGAIVAHGWGYYRVYVAHVHHGMVLVHSQDAARVRRTLYTRKRTSDSFTLDVVFPSWQELWAFLDWQYGYLKAISDPHNKTVGHTDIIVPSRDFSKQAIPAGGLVYDDSVESITYPLSIDWKGTSDPGVDVGSDFEPAPNDPQSEWYYPLTVPLDGSPAIGRQREGVSFGSYLETQTKPPWGIGPEGPHNDPDEHLGGRPDHL